MMMKIATASEMTRSRSQLRISLATREVSCRASAGATARLLSDIYLFDAHSSETLASCGVSQAGKITFTAASLLRLNARQVVGKFMKKKLLTLACVTVFAASMSAQWLGQP